MDLHQSELNDHGARGDSSAVATGTAAASPLAGLHRRLRLEDLPGIIVCKIWDDMDPGTDWAFIQAFFQAELIKNGEREEVHNSSAVAVPVSSATSAVTNGPGQSRIETLPGEIVYAIMKLMNAESLLTFVQASKTTYEAFKGVEGLVTHAVSERTVGAELLPIALSCLMAKDLGLQDKVFSGMARGSAFRIAKDFIKTSVSKDASVLMVHPNQFNLQVALRLAKSHQKLLDFPNTVCSLVVSHRFNVLGFTQLEKTRVLKALYLFDLLRHLVTPITSYRDASLEEEVSNTLWSRMGPLAAFQVMEFVTEYLCPRFIGFADGYAVILSKMGHEEFHEAYPHTRIDTENGVDGRDCSHPAVECAWNRITSPMTFDSALAFSLQHGSEAVRRKTRDEYVEMYLSTAWDQFSHTTWHRIEIDHYHIDINVGGACWYSCPDDTPKSIARRANDMARTFDTQDDCVFRMWLWHLFARCDPALGAGNDDQTGPLQSLCWDTVFRSTSSMKKFGTLPPPIEWVEELW